MVALVFNLLPSQDLPIILSSKSQQIEKGLKIEFLFSSFIERGDVSSWIEQENWFIINFYNIIRPESDFFDNLKTYPIQEIQQEWSQNALQLSIQINRSIGMFDVMIDDKEKEVLLVLTYSDFIESKEEIICILKNAMKNIHRLPIIIQPVIMSLKEEIIKRLSLI